MDIIDFSRLLPNLLINYVPVVTMGMSKQGDGCISTEVLHYMSAFEISKLDRIVYQRGWILQYADYSSFFRKSK